MVKKVTFIAIRSDSTIPWYNDSDEASNDPHWKERLAFINSNRDILTITVDRSDEFKITTEMIFTDEVKYQEFMDLTSTIVEPTAEYCNRNGMYYVYSTDDV
jgi:hypothetical protein